MEQLRLDASHWLALDPRCPDVPLDKCLQILPDLLRRAASLLQGDCHQDASLLATALQSKIDQVTLARSMMREPPTELARAYFTASFNLCILLFSRFVWSEDERERFFALVCEQHGPLVVMQPNPSSRYQYDARSVLCTKLGHVVRAVGLDGAPVMIKHSYWRLLRARRHADTEDPLREVRVIYGLQPWPPGIRRVVEVSVDEEKHWMVMEYCHSGNLWDRLVTLATAPVQLIRTLFLQLVDTVQFIHARGYAHIDLRFECSICIAQVRIHHICCESSQSRQHSAE